MKTLVIDPGHGGADSGASAFGYYEKDLVLVIAKRVQELLKEYSPDITRTTDRTLANGDRTAMIRDKYKYCLSFHLNSFNGAVRGIEAIHSIHSAKGKELATMIANNLTKTLNIPLRRVFSRKGSSGNDFYFMHRNTGSTTTVIVEGLFLDNAEDIKQLNVENIAQAIAKGFKEFMKGEKIDSTGSDELVYSRTLYQGIKGEDVKRLQIRLTEIGFSTNGIDGSFGRNTRTAVEHFQSYMKLNLDARVGPATIRALNNFKKKVDNISKYEVLRPNAQTTVAKIPHENIKEIKTIIANNKSKAETLQSMKNRSNVDIIINGGIYYYSDKYKDNRSLNLLVHEGKTIVAGTYSKYSLMTEKDGSYRFGWYDWNPNRMTGIGGSPALVIDGKINLDKGTLTNDIHNVRHPRSAIGMNKDFFFMVIIDGRKSSQGLNGMTNKQLADYMLNKLKCEHAIGFDGGWSSTIIGNEGVLNKSYTGRKIHNSVGIVLN